MVARGQKLLTDAKIRSALKKPGNYNDGDGLRLKVAPSGKAHWTVRYSLFGKERETSIGSYPATSLASARAIKDEIRTDAKNGFPHTHRRSSSELEIQAHEITFRECAERFIEKNQSRWSNKKHANQWISTLATYAFPTIGPIPTNNLETRHIADVLHPIWTKIPETATRLRQRIKTVIDYSIAMGFRTDRFNPAAWDGNLQYVLAKPQSIRTVKHQPSLDYRRLPDLMQEVAKKQSLSSLALQLCILTVNRTTPVIMARWEDLDVTNLIWTIPAEHMKTKKEFRVPLNEHVLTLVESIPKQNSPYVFPSPQDLSRPINENSLRIHLHRDYPSELITEESSKTKNRLITVHGFRSTFRIWAAECSKASHEVIEMSMQHAIKNPVEAAYQRSDLIERRNELLTEWGTYCLSGVYRWKK